MDLKQKIYQQRKIKKDFKNKTLILFFNSARLNNKIWLKIEQLLKNQKLGYTKILNSSTLEALNNSIFKNFNQTVCGTVIIISPNYRLTEFNIRVILKKLSPLFVLVSVKLNNKIYSTNQIKHLNVLNYKSNVISLLKTFDASLLKLHLYFKNISK